MPEKQSEYRRKVFWVGGEHGEFYINFMAASQNFARPPFGIPKCKGYKTTGRNLNFHLRSRSHHVHTTNKKFILWFRSWFLPHDRNRSWIVVLPKHSADTEAQHRSV